MNQRQVTFQEAVRSAIFNNYCNFSGRASRSDFWWYILFTCLLSWAVVLLCSLLGFSPESTQAVGGLINLGLFLPGLGLWVRRLHDIDRCGWWVLLAFVPVIGIIVLIVWACQNSQMHPNRYGAVPNVVP